MAGDWIKIEKATPRKPEILHVAEMLGVSADQAFGLCFRFWSWCDDHLKSGHAPNVTSVTLDLLLNHDGFASALLKTGWLRDRNGSIEVPNFERHLSQSAKNRSLAADRQRQNRSRKSNGESVTQALPEKRREECIKPLTPLQIRIGKLLGRRETTKWSKKELAALREIGTPHEDDLAMIEDFYGAIIPKDRDYRRTALQTLLNNWNGEVDKARLWKSENP